jgi:hypothetical protein
VSGTAAGTIEGQAMAALLNGHVRIRGGTPETVLADCEAADHKLEFTRTASAARR